MTKPLNALQKTYRAAQRVGGAEMPESKYPRLFADDTAFRRNVLRACANPRWGKAIEDGVFADSRVIESLHKLGNVPSCILLDVETRLGRKLTRARAIALAKAYCAVQARKVVTLRQSTNVIDFPLRLAA